MAGRDLQSTPNAYHAHRERQRRRILSAAERLFDEHGIDRVTMLEIVAAAGLRASTLYQYFSSKDDIVWALVRETMEHAYVLDVPLVVEVKTGRAWSDVH